VKKCRGRLWSEPDTVLKSLNENRFPEFTEELRHCLNLPNEGLSLLI